MADIESYDQFIDGEFVSSEGDDRAEVKFPYDGELWATVPLGTPGDVDSAVAAARDAFERDDWAGLQPSERASLLREVATVINEHADELAELETRQNGKLIREMSGQMNSLGDWFRYYASQCETREGDTIPVESKDGEMFNYVVEEPYGVVGAITPSELPASPHDVQTRARARRRLYVRPQTQHANTCERTPSCRTPPRRSPPPRRRLQRCHR